MIIIDMFTSIADHLASINAYHIILGCDFNVDSRLESVVTKFLLDTLKRIQVRDCYQSITITITSCLRIH